MLLRVFVYVNHFFCEVWLSVFSKILRCGAADIVNMQSIFLIG